MNMAMYKNDARARAEEAELEALQEEYRKQFSGEPQEVVEPVVPVTPAEVQEEETWKKRHGDLRSYTSRQINDLEKKLAEVEKALLEKDKNPKLPANETEAEEWIKEYPDLARVLGTMIDKRAEQHVTSVSDEVRDVKMQLEAERTATARERAYNEILRIHPDFPVLVNDLKFQEWVERQPLSKAEGGRGIRIGQAIYDALYKNDTDAEAAIEAVDVYKADTEALKPKKNNVDREVAASVRKTTSATPVTNDGKRTFSESEIDKMKPWDYDKYEKEIEEARRDGRIVYDLSGAAR
jgi:hypothetical protein